MAEHGGYRKPASPAAVSGPGALSQRTDGRPNVADLSNAAYGENKAFRDIETSAPMGAPGPAGGGGGAPVQLPTGLGEPTSLPGQPVTHGADAGLGPGSDSLGIPDSSDEVADLRARYGPILPVLIRMADSPQASQQLRDQVRYVISKIT